MKIAYLPEDGTLLIAEAGVHYQHLTELGTLRWDRRRHVLAGYADLSTLNALAELVQLPPELDAKRAELQQMQQAINAQRLNPEPRPLLEPPVHAALYRHQIRAMNMALLRFGVVEPDGTARTSGESTGGFGLLFEMGCGKTLTALAIAGVLYNTGKIRRVLVACPTSITAVWEKDIRTFAAFPFATAVLQGEKSKRLDALAALCSVPEEVCRFAVINYESTFRDGIFQALQRYDADLIICDESQRIKNPTAAQSKALHRLGDAARYRLILSGTPISGQAADLYSQYRFLDVRVFGNNFYAFRNRYCVTGGYQCREITGYQHLDELTRRAYTIAYRATKRECLDLPEQIFSTRVVRLRATERRIYDQIRRDSFAALENGDTLTAATVLTKLLRLQQITGGFLQPDDGGKPRAVNTAKLDALADILEDLEPGKKLVIFARFRPELDAIRALLKQKGIRCGYIAGDVPQKDRGGIVRDFQENPETTAFVAQTATAGLGITLTAASVTVFYSVGYNYAEYEQATARTHRIGQAEPCTYLHLVVEDSVDETVLQALQRKEDIAHSIVDSWRNYFA